MNALNLWKESPPVLSLGCRILDAAIGGLPLQGITEIAGEAGCGKTQLCLTMSLQIQVDQLHGGKNGAVAYLSCGEGTFPIRRLSQMALVWSKATGIPSQDLLSNVHIEQCYNIDDAQTILRHKIPELCQKKNVKLLIIDSLAGLVRFEFDNRNASDMRARTVLLFSLARELKLLSDIFKIGVIVVNQVKGDFMDELPPLAGLVGSEVGSGCRGNGVGGGGGSVPALGMAWAYCVNTRITLHRDSAHIRACPVTADYVSEEEGGEKETRHLYCARNASDYLAVSVGCKRGAADCVDDEAFYSISHQRNKHSGSSSNAFLDKGAGLHGPPLHERTEYYPYETTSTASVRSIRYMRLDLSSTHSEVQCSYEINNWGVCGIKLD